MSDSIELIRKHEDAKLQIRRLTSQLLEATNELEAMGKTLQEEVARRVDAERECARLREMHEQVRERVDREMGRI